jgi:hypothetical protein
MATAAKQTRSPRTVSASFTIRPEQPTGAEPGNQVGSIAVEQPQCYRPTRRIILSAMPRKSLRSWLTRSIGLAEANWTRVSPIPWPTSQASFCARWNRGPMEEQLAKLEATLGLVQNRQPVNS